MDTLFELTEAEMLAGVAAVMWPFMRIGAMFVAMPILGTSTMLVRARILLAFAFALFIAPLLPPPPQVDPISAEGLLIAVQQVLIGISMGFILQMAMTAMAMAGQSIALSMGLGFATMVDPITGAQTPVISQFLVTLGMLLFLTLGGHLLAFEILLDSFRTLPIGELGMVREDAWYLVRWGGQMYAGGLLIALPVVGSVLLVNMAYGVITRFAQQLNIFAVGFPITMLLGLAILAFSLPSVGPKFMNLLLEAFNLIGRITRGAGA